MKPNKITIVVYEQTECLTTLRQCWRNL